MDVRIDGRFRAYTEVGGITVRALSDSDTQLRRRVALEESAAVREELTDTESARHKELVSGPIAEATDDEMREAIIRFAASDAEREAAEAFPFRFVPFPDGASLEERHEVLKKREESEAAVMAERLGYVSNRTARLHEKAKGWDTDVLGRELARRIIESWVWAAYGETFQYQTLVLACFRDGEPVFSSWRDVAQFSEKLVAKLFEAYREVDDVDPWELEKNVLTEPTMAS